MKGCLLIYRAAGPLASPPETQELTGLPSLETLQALVGGDIQQIPAFTTIDGDKPCVAFGDENGKVKSLPVNRRATLLWDAAARRVSPDGSGLLRNGHFSDVLVGTVVVLTGDREFFDAWAADGDDDGE